MKRSAIAGMLAAVVALVFSLFAASMPVNAEYTDRVGVPMRITIYIPGAPMPPPDPDPTSTTNPVTQGSTPDNGSHPEPQVTTTSPPTESTTTQKPEDPAPTKTTASPATPEPETTATSTEKGTSHETPAP